MASVAVRARWALLGDHLLHLGDVERAPALAVSGQHVVVGGLHLAFVAGGRRAGVGATRSARREIGQGKRCADLGRRELYLIAIAEPPASPPGLAYVPPGRVHGL